MAQSLKTKETFFNRLEIIRSTTARIENDSKIVERIMTLIPSEESHSAG